MVEFQIKIKKIQNSEFIIQNLRWRGVGCAISTAAASLLSERVKQIRQISQISQISQAEMVKFLGGGISHARIKCATLPLVALQKAISNFQPKADPPVAETI